MSYRKGMDLSPYLKRYGYFPKLTDLLFGEIANDIRERGYLTFDDLAIIYVWKTLLWQIERKLESHGIERDELMIRNVTSQIFRVKHSIRDDVIDIISKLDYSLRGVGIQVSSCILAVVFPDRYGIFDIHVQRALNIQGNDARACADAIFKMREIAEEQGKLSGVTWTPRMVDKALWVLNKSS